MSIYVCLASITMSILCLCIFTCFIKDRTRLCRIDRNCPKADPSHCIFYRTVKVLIDWSFMKCNYFYQLSYYIRISATCCCRFDKVDIWDSRSFHSCWERLCLYYTRIDARPYFNNNNNNNNNMILENCDKGTGIRKIATMAPHNVRLSYSAKLLWNATFTIRKTVTWTWPP